MRRIVIADDLTGAAELAGIAWSCGLSTHLVVASPETDLTANGVGEADVLVVATDTRSMTEAEAVAETKRVAGALKAVLQSATIFKKVDSALRGHVVAELRQLMRCAGKGKAVYMPANPSKGRIIRNGIYYIKDEKTLKPLAETAFATDPEFPAFSSVLRERFPDAEATGIMMPDATSEADIAAIVAGTDSDTIMAGAADLFKAHLTATQKGETVTPADRKTATPSSEDKTLILCGSTQSRIDSWQQPASAMPLAVYEGGCDLTDWQADALTKYEGGQGGVVLCIGYNHLTGHDSALHLRLQMGRMAAWLMERHQPAHLVIEGGATAFCTLQQAGIRQLRIVRQLAPGVVTMQADSGMLVTLKPGSYSWNCSI